MLRVVTLGGILFCLGTGTGYANCDNSSLNGVYPFTKRLYDGNL
jgi:hypothetical protein